ncbi:hypothetical protein ABWH93_06715 [Seohaeicola saemankumensis]|uniref:hypothetical protein n=1 Tax=Seohaeicola saemankumensis TaxID=481181 RepID=UPI0035D0345E
MQPKFTLELSSEAIRLLFDLNGEPCVLGDVSPSSKQLVSEMAALRLLATEISKPPIVTMAVVPRGHVLYETVKLVFDQEVTEAKVIDYICKEAQLDKDGICVDWVVDGSHLHIAAIEKLTLLEAGDFAKQHGFVAAVFTSYVSTDKFPRMPVFLEPNSPKKLRFTMRQEDFRRHQDGE